MRDGDSGLDSPEAHGPCGWIIGPGAGVDKGDEFVMQVGWGFLRLDSYVAPPARIQASPCEDPDLLRMWLLPAGVNQRLVSLRKEFRPCLLRPLCLHSDPHLGVPSSDPRKVRSFPARFDLLAVG